MKKLITILVIFCLFSNGNIALATNTYTASVVYASSQYYQANDSVSLSPTGDITIMLWVKLTTLPSTGQQYRFLDKSNDAGTQVSYDIFTLPNGKVYTEITSDGAWVHYAQTITNSQVLFTGTWYHVAAVWDVSTSAATIYINGSSAAASSSGDATAIFNGNAKLCIGCQAWDAPIRFVNGQMDDVRIYSGAMTQAQIQAVYNCSLVGDESGLLAYWRFDNDLNDSTSNGNTLTAYNSPTFQNSSLPFTNTCAGASVPKPVISPLIFFE